MRSLRRPASFLLSTLVALSAASAASAQELFQDQPNPFGAQACNGSGCWTNYMQLADVDNDGDLDVFFPNASGFFNKGNQAQPLVMYRNDGNATFTNASTDLGGGLTGWVRQVTFADITGDGFLDIYAPAAWNDPDKLYVNNGAGAFTDELAARLPGVASKAGATRFGDVDNDGDMDLLVGDNWTGIGGGPIAHLYVNDGTGHFAESGAQLPNNAQGDQPDDFDLLDADGDFDLDLFVNMHTGTKGSLWLNDGTGTFTDASGNIPSQQGGLFRYGPVPCDVDGDGDLDLWQDNATNNGREQLLINNGSGAFADETAARVTGNPGADDNGVVCVDYDGDGDLDAAVMSLSNVERLLQNDGTGHFTLVNGGFTNVNDPTLWMDFGDLDGDGRLDAVTAQGEGNPQTERLYLGTAMVPVDTVAPKIRAFQTISAPSPDESPVVRFAVSDNVTTDTGPRLKKAFLKVTANGTTEVKATFMGGDLFRATLPAQAGGTLVTFQACATDRQDNEGCSAPQMYTVTGSGPATTGSGGGNAGGSGAGGNAGGSGGNAGGGNAGGSGGVGNTGGAGGSGGFTLDEGGCGCAIPGGAAGSGASLLAGVATALAAVARRRHAKKK